MSLVDWTQPIFDKDGREWKVVTDLGVYKNVDLKEKLITDPNYTERSVWTCSGGIYKVENQFFNGAFKVTNKELADEDLAKQFREANKLSYKLFTELANRGYTVEDAEGYELEAGLAHRIFKTSTKEL